MDTLYTMYIVQQGAVSARKQHTDEVKLWVQSALVWQLRACLKNPCFFAFRFVAAPYPQVTCAPTGCSRKEGDRDLVTARRHLLF